MDNETLKDIIRTAFKKGELWGVTYSTWFEPNEEQTEEQIEKAIDEILD